MQDDEARPDFFSITTLGERGQIVIPKEARDAFHLEPGSKLVVLPSKRGNGILLMKEEGVKEAAQRLSERADHMSQKSKRLQDKLHDVEQES